MKAYRTSTSRTSAALAFGALILAGPPTMAAPISVSSYTYGTGPESQPQPTNFQGGSISDVGNVKLTDGLLATGSWNDGTNVGFRNDADNGNPQPRVTFDLGALHAVATIDIWTVSAFLGSNESVSISSSADGVTFSAPVVVNPISWASGFGNSNLRQGSIDVSALPDGQFYQMDVFDTGQWNMINEVQFDGSPSVPDTTPPTLASGDIVDDRGGASINAGLPVTYTVTFSEDMDEATFAAADFSNAGTAAITIGTITETSPGVFSIEVTPTTTGSLQLQVPIGATLTDDASPPNALDTASAILDDTTITVDPPDSTDPTLSGSDIIDNKSGGPVNAGNLVIYTVTFNEAMDAATVDAADFGNAGTSAITVGGISETAPGVFSVAVTPTDVGTLQLAVVAGAVLTDLTGNPLDSSSAIVDDTTISVSAAVVGPIVATGWNRDFILGSGETHAAHDQPENANIWFADNLGITPGAGIPASGAVVVSGRDFQFQPFTGGTSNGLRAAGTLTLTTPARYAEISFLAASTGGGAGTWNVTLNFTDAAPADATYSAPPNWATFGGEFDPTLTGNGTTSGFGGAMVARSIDLDALGLSGSTLESIDFLGSDGANGNAAIFALNGVGTGGADLTPPTLTGNGIVDDQGGGPVFQDALVTFTLSFSEDMDTSTFSAADFGNAGTAPITVGAITTVAPGGVTVEVTPTAPGTLQFEVAAGATLNDKAGNPLDASSAIVDDTTITVDPPDLISPTLAGTDIVDDQFGGPVTQFDPVTYTVTFSEDMDEATVEAADFGNAGTSAITIGAITETAPGVFSIEVTPGTPGTLQLEVVAGASVADPSGNLLDTAIAITDDTSITVEDRFPNAIAIASYEYGANAESQPQPTNWQDGSISDVGNIKLTDHRVATGGWKDFTNVGFRNDSENGNPQPRVTFDLGGNFSLSTIEVFSVTAFAALDSVDVSTSTDGTNFGAPVSFPLTFSGGFTNPDLTQVVLDVSALPAATHVRLDFFQDTQWAMINEVVINGGPADYGAWAARFPAADLSDPNADFDGDGLTNDYERLFGLDPTDPASANPIAVPLDAAEGTLSFTRRDDALTGKFSRIETSTDLVTWTDDGGAMLLAGDPVDDIETVTVTLSNHLLDEPRLFVRVVQDDGVILSEDFEDGDGGFAVVDRSGGTGSLWVHGIPNSDGGLGGGAVTSGNGGSAQCWGTNIGNPGTYLTGTDTSLISPVIDLSTVTGATLSFAQAIDILSPDSLVVNIIEADISGGVTVIGSAIHTADDAGTTTDADWQQVSGLDLAGGVGQQVRIEWRFAGNGDGTYLGAYLDDVTVSKALP